MSRLWFITLVDRLSLCQPSCCSSESIHCSCSSMNEDNSQSAGRRSQKLRGGELVPADILVPMSRSQKIDLGTRLHTKHHPRSSPPSPPSPRARRHVPNVISQAHKGVACVMNTHTRCRWVSARALLDAGMARYAGWRRRVAVAFHLLSVLSFVSWFVVLVAYVHNLEPAYKLWCTVHHSLYACSINGIS